MRNSLGMGEHRNHGVTLRNGRNLVQTNCIQSEWAGNQNTAKLPTTASHRSMFITLSQGPLFQHVGRIKQKLTSNGNFIQKFDFLICIFNRIKNKYRLAIQVELNMPIFYDSVIPFLNIQCRETLTHNHKVLWTWTRSSNVLCNKKNSNPQHAICYTILYAVALFCMSWKTKSIEQSKR